MKTVAVVDGLGGGIGVQLVERFRREGIADLELIALGTNAVATQRMVEAGADRGASGENAFRVSLARADFIIGPIGIILPDSMMGEVSADMCQAVLNAPGKRILLPLNQSHILIAGMAQKNLSELVENALALLTAELAKT